MAGESSETGKTGAWGMSEMKGSGAGDFLKKKTVSSAKVIGRVADRYDELTSNASEKVFDAGQKVVKTAGKANKAWNRGAHTIAQKHAAQAAELKAAREEGREAFSDPDGIQRMPDGLTAEQRAEKDAIAAEKAKGLRNAFNSTNRDDSAVKADKAPYAAIRALSKTPYMPAEPEAVDMDLINKNVGYQPNAFEKTLLEREANQKAVQQEVNSRLSRVLREQGDNLDNVETAKALVDDGHLTVNELNGLKKIATEKGLTSEQKSQKLADLSRKVTESQTHVRGGLEEKKRQEKEAARKAAEVARKDAEAKAEEAAEAARKAAEAAAVPKTTKPETSTLSTAEKVGGMLRGLGLKLPEAAAVGIAAATGVDLARRLTKVAVGTEKVALAVGAVGAIGGGARETFSIIRDKRKAKNTARQEAVNTKVAAAEPSIAAAVTAGANEAEVRAATQKKAEDEARVEIGEDKLVRHLLELAKTPSEHQRVLGKMGENFLMYALSTYLFMQLGPGFLEQAKQQAGGDWMEKVRNQQITPEMTKMLGWFKNIVTEGIKETS